MEREYHFTVNGTGRDVKAEPCQTLLDPLRDRLGLTGSKKGCNEGECASCTVLVNGVPVNSCLVLIGDAGGKSIVTIEGIATDQGLHPMQDAFVNLGGVQCGFCTPGMMLTARALLERNPDPTDAEIREAISGQICRCTGYATIVRSIRWAAEHSNPEVGS